MIWAAPPRDHPLRRLWEITHWRRVRRFNRYLRARIDEDFQARIDEWLEANLARLSPSDPTSEDQ